MTEKIEIIAVETKSHISEVARLAGEIWREHYLPIIGTAQVEFMLAKFQTPAAIAEQIAGGHEYYIARLNGKNEGYCALAAGPGANEAMLSKLYVRRQSRGRGIGKAMLRFLEARCREKGFTELWLRVNKNNKNSIRFYEKSGFRKSGELVSDIGDGFVMDDYLMRKRLEAESRDKKP